MDVIVIGGGSAGLMACVAAAREGARVALVEKGDRLARKLIISGGGRCNVTNNKPVRELVAQIPGNGKFLFGALSRFGPRDIIRFFESLGVRLKEEDNGRMFPVTDKALTVAETLIRHIRELGVAILQEAPVERIRYEGGRVAGVRLRGGEELDTPAVVLAAGGKSVPRTGSTGDGYAWAREAGHTITWLYPTEAPLLSDEPWVRARALQGMALRDAALTLWDGSKKLTTQHGDALFTHFGFSGPAVLRLAHYVNVGLRDRPGEALLLTIDLQPEENPEETYSALWLAAQDHPKRVFRNALKAFVPERLGPLLLEMAAIPPDATGAQLAKARVRQLALLIHRFPARVTGTAAIEEAFVTGGGVSVAEIDPQTMASRLMPGLFFAGEVMDVHAHTGGYNITIAFSTGHVAGEAAARFSLAAASPTQRE